MAAKSLSCRISSDTDDYYPTVALTQSVCLKVPLSILQAANLVSISGESTRCAKRREMTAVSCSIEQQSVTPWVCHQPC